MTTESIYWLIVWFYASSILIVFAGFISLLAQNMLLRKRLRQATQKRQTLPGQLLGGPTEGCQTERQL